jgi:hypothetical protein
MIKKYVEGQVVFSKQFGFGSVVKVDKRTLVLYPVEVQFGAHDGIVHYTKDGRYISTISGTKHKGDLVSIVIPQCVVKLLLKAQVAILTNKKARTKCMISEGERLAVQCDLYWDCVAQRSEEFEVIDELSSISLGEYYLDKDGAVDADGDPDPVVTEHIASGRYSVRNYIFFFI